MKFDNLIAIHVDAKRWWNRKEKKFLHGVKIFIKAKEPENLILIENIPKYLYEIKTYESAKEYYYKTLAFNSFCRLLDNNTEYAFRSYKEDLEACCKKVGITYFESSSEVRLRKHLKW